MKKTVLLLFCSLTFLAACQKEETTSDPKIKQLEAEQTNLTQELDDSKVEMENLSLKVHELQKQLEDVDKEREIFPVISNLSREFVRAHTTGDKALLSQLISEEIVLQENAQQLFAIVEGTEWSLYSETNKSRLDDWVIQGYEYRSDNETVSVFIREFFTDSNGEPESPPTFLHLSFKMVGEEWKVYQVAFDV